eukprot:TRINITY_DN2692_c0_g1_i1.p2 TRINITY_DN2692_c0_g1~~TRINITY_DN2692_c0_g1_i1.p2  ORF type:complete len:134 (+),score=31.22 TRINITY_DN2692_c0_g1_i1:573-974(+)
MGQERIDGESVVNALAHILKDSAEQVKRNPLALITGPGIFKLGLTRHDREIKRKVKLFRELAFRIVRARKENIRKVYGKDATRKDLLQIFLEKNNEGGEGILNNEELVSLFMIFFAAGLDHSDDGHVLSVQAP